jgi:hypothetical protein
MLDDFDKLVIASMIEDIVMGCLSRYFGPWPKLSEGPRMDRQITRGERPKRDPIFEEQFNALFGNLYEKPKRAVRVNKDKVVKFDRRRLKRKTK